MLKLSLFSLITLILVVRGQLYTNRTVDDINSDIAYAGTWSLTKPTPLDYPFDSQSSHQLSETGGTATFSFTGVAVYFWSPKWPYLVNSRLSLDGEPGECINLQDPLHSSGEEETIQSAPVWGRDGLANTNHILVVSRCVNGPYVVVDAFTYTIAAPPDLTSTSPSTSTSPTPTVSSTSPSTSTSPTPIVSSTSGAAFSSSSSAPSTETTMPKSRKIAIAVGGAVGGVVVSVILVLAIFFCFQRRGPRDTESIAVGGETSWQDNSSVLMAGSPTIPNATLQPQPGYHPTQQSMLFHPALPPNSQYNPNAPYNRWTPSSPESYYPKSLTPISEGSPPSSHISKYRDLPKV